MSMHIMFHYNNKSNKQNTISTFGLTNNKKTRVHPQLGRHMKFCFKARVHSHHFCLFVKSSGLTPLSLFPICICICILPIDTESTEQLKEERYFFFLLAFSNLLILFLKSKIKSVSLSIYFFSLSEYISNSVHLFLYGMIHRNDDRNEWQILHNCFFLIIFCYFVFFGC